MNTRALAADANDHTPAAPVPLSPSMAENAGYLLHRAFQHVHADTAGVLGDEMHARDLTLLAHLLAGGPASQQQLAERFTVNRSVMVKRIDALEQAGLVVRARNPLDRRLHAVTATERAAPALAAYEPKLLAAESLVLRRLTAAERRRLRALLIRLLGRALPAVAAPVSETTGYLIARAHHWLRAQADQACAPLGLDVREHGALSTLNDIAPCTQQQLATLMGVTGPVIVELVDALEPRGLVRRDRNPADRRSYALVLTASGREMLTRTSAAIETIREEVRERIGADGDRQLCALLRRLIGAADPPG